MLSVAIDLCKNIVDIIQKNKSANQQSKIRISEVLNEISNILEDTAKKISEDEYPHMNCQVMKNFANELHFYMMDYLNNDKIDQLHKTLIEASEIEKTYALRKDPETIPTLYEAAGEFKALSILIKL